MHKAYFGVNTKKFTWTKMGRKPKPNAKRYFLSVRLDEQDKNVWIKILKSFDVEVDEFNPLSTECFRRLLFLAKLKFDVQEAEERLKHAPYFERKFWESF